MKKIEKILVPIDFSKHSEQIVDYSCLLAEKLNAEIVLCYVAESFSNYTGFSIPNISIEDVEKGLLDSAHEPMNSYIAQVEKAGVQCRGKMLAGIIHTEILTFSKAEDVDMIVIGTHGYSAIEKFLIGSVAMKILAASPCPVLKLNPYE